MVVASSFYNLVGIVDEFAYHLASDGEFIEVETPDGRKDEYQKKFWYIDPT